MFHHLAQLLSHFCQILNQPKQNQADSGTVKIQVNPTQVRQMGHPAQGVPCARRLGFVDLDLECSALCPTLLGLMGIWQKRLGTWASTQKSKSTHPRSTSTSHAMYDIVTLLGNDKSVTITGWHLIS